MRAEVRAGRAAPAKPPRPKPERERDRPLDGFWELAEETFNRLVLPLLPVRTTRRVRIVMRRLIGAAVMAARGDWTGYVSYSRTHDYYSDRVRYGGDELFTCHLVTTAVEVLEFAGLIDHDRRLPGQRGRQSRYRLLPHVLATLEDEAFQHRDRPLIRLRDAAGQDLPLPETDEVRRLTAEAAGMRAWLRDVEIRLPEDTCTREGQHWWRVPTEKVDRVTGVVTLGSMRFRQDPFIDIYRIFNRGDIELKLGGRWYWSGQQLPGAVRGRMQIRTAGGEWTDVVELDYRAMHLRMCYAMEGLDYEAHGGDPYKAVQRLGFERPDVKDGMVIGINALTLRSTVGATARKTGRSKALANALMSAIKRVHGPIAHRIHSDAGLGLMRHESDIAADVMRRCRRAGFVCLPVHDSFIAPAAHEADLRRFMDEAWEAWAAKFRKAAAPAKPVVAEASTVAVKFTKTYLHEPAPVLLSSSWSLADEAACEVDEVEFDLGPVEPRLPAGSKILRGVASWERFLNLAEARYGSSARRLGEGSDPADLGDLVRLCDDASPKTIRTLFGTRGLEVLGLPFARDWEADLYRGWGRDPVRNPIPEHVLRRFNPNRLRRRRPEARQEAKPRRPAVVTPQVVPPVQAAPVAVLDPFLAAVRAAIPGAVVVALAA